jgi:signal transduction histidine kinase
VSRERDSLKLQAPEVPAETSGDHKRKVDLAILFVEDSETDVALVARALGRAGFTPTWERVQTEASLREALTRRSWQVVVSDSSVPGLGPLDALRVTRELEPHTPFFVLSGSIVPELAVEVMRNGAADWITKGELDRLVAVIHRQLEQAPATTATRVLAAQEAERREIARALHDELGQVLTALQMTIVSARHARGIVRQRHLDHALRLIEQSVTQVRAVALGLWPTILDDLGLPAALRWLAQRDGRRDELTIDVEIDDVGRLPSEVEIACFRVAQEALTNAMRHAGARAIHVRLRASADDVRVEVEDEGVGFDVSAAWQRASAGESLGLASMRERVVLAGGRFELEVAPGKGTIVRASVPIARKGAR